MIHVTASFFLYSFRLDTLQQSKARLELSNQTLKQQHQKELEGREEEVEQVRTAMNKKLKALSQQLEDMHEEKQAAVKVGPKGALLLLVKGVASTSMVDW